MQWVGFPPSPDNMGLFVMMSLHHIFVNFCRKLRGLSCFLNFDRVRGWFDTEFQETDGFTVSSLTVLLMPMGKLSSIVYLLCNAWDVFLNVCVVLCLEYPDLRCMTIWKELLEEECKSGPYKSGAESLKKMELKNNFAPLSIEILCDHSMECLIS